MERVAALDRNRGLRDTLFSQKIQQTKPRGSGWCLLIVNAGRAFMSDTKTLLEAEPLSKAWRSQQLPAQAKQDAYGMRRLH
jgi:hypothetical protein